MSPCKRLLMLLLVLLGYLGFTEGGKLIMVGGGLADANTNVWDKIVEMAGGPGVARIGIVTAASSTPVDSAGYYLEMFALYGTAEEYWIPVHMGNLGANSDPDVVRNVQRMNGIFFGGGDQSRIINSFFTDVTNRVRSPVLDAIWEVFNRDGVIGGTSAGAAVMGTGPMLMGGMSYEALRYGAFTPGNEGSSDDLVYDELGGLGFLPGFIVDSHYSERGREGRLIRLISDTKSLPIGVNYGVGVDEDVGLAITNVGTSDMVAEVVGVEDIWHGAQFVDLSQSSVDTSGNYWAINNVFAHYLTRGDFINLTNWQPTFASWKQNMRGNERYDNAVTSDKIFNGNRDNQAVSPEFVYVAVNIFDSRLDTVSYGDTLELNPRFRVTMTQMASSTGFGGYDNSEYTRSYHQMRIDIGQSLIFLRVSDIYEISIYIPL